MKITIRDNNCFFHTGCQICGEDFELAVVNAGFYDDALEWCDVCVDCIRAGPDGMKQRAREKADHFKTTEHLQFADELAAEKITAPTMADLKDALAMQYAAMYGNDVEDFNAVAEVELGLRERTPAELEELQQQPF